MVRRGMSTVMQKTKIAHQFLYELESLVGLPENAKGLKFLRMETSRTPLPYCFKTIGYVKQNADGTETLISVLPGEEGKAGEETLCWKARSCASREEDSQDAGHEGETKLFLTYKNKAHPLFSPAAKWNAHGPKTLELLLKIRLGFCPIYITVDGQTSFIDYIDAIQRSSFETEGIANNIDFAECEPGALSIPFTDLHSGSITMVEYDVTDNADIIKEDIVSVRVVEQ